MEAWQCCQIRSEICLLWEGGKSKEEQENEKDKGLLILIRQTGTRNEQTNKQTGSPRSNGTSAVDYLILKTEVGR